MTNKTRRYRRSRRHRTFGTAKRRGGEHSQNLNKTPIPTFPAFRSSGIVRIPKTVNPFNFTQNPLKQEKQASTVLPNTRQASTILQQPRTEKMSLSKKLPQKPISQKQPKNLFAIIKEKPNDEEKFILNEKYVNLDNWINVNKYDPKKNYSINEIKTFSGVEDEDKEMFQKYVNSKQKLFFNIKILKEKEQKLLFNRKILKEKEQKLKEKEQILKEKEKKKILNYFFNSKVKNDYKEAKNDYVNAKNDYENAINIIKKPNLITKYGFLENW